MPETTSSRKLILGEIKPIRSKADYEATLAEVQRL
jgi:hypothetical protein